MFREQTEVLALSLLGKQTVYKQFNKQRLLLTIGYCYDYDYRKFHYRITWYANDRDNMTEKRCSNSKLGSKGFAEVHVKTNLDREILLVKAQIQSIYLA